ncbi:MAG TPA: ADP-forming succinate--CoA ligase subunit beta [Thermoflexales bacterium]|nr:ADP-forming succinate--CoA ligase subunit beta [Thermoflexales bacterium]HQW33822.1 ADP-forming succinate--CoA ligase subunit beta [Thermoflexales bacterium]HQZ21464.1 ADP-forming succinate--CoA ligase subunit beta [Thermoflexales bacterium]
MKLHEYQAKRIFGEYGIAVPRGVVADTPALARAAAAQIGLPVVIKAQVLTGGRGKAGGVKVAKTLDEVEAKAKDILALSIKDIPVEKVLIDPAANIKHEIYLGVTMDRPNRRALLMASAAGGMDIEEVAATTPEKIIRVHVDPFIGMPDYLARDVAVNLGLPKELWSDFVAIALGLVKCYAEKDCSLAEINPLAIVEQDGKQKLMALDGKMVIEDNALYRHPELEAIRNPDEETAAEKTARETGINFISLDGTIGCMVNGAGLAMATMDIVNFYGGTPANFLDVGGGAKADKVASAMRLILSDQKVRGVLINIFGGITRCDEVAKGVVEAMNIVKPTVPIVVRLVGTNQEEGNRILASANMATASTLGEAAQKVVELSK